MKCICPHCVLRLLSDTSSTITVVSPREGAKIELAEKIKNKNQYINENMDKQWQCCNENNIQKKRKLEQCCNTNPDSSTNIHQ